MSDKKSKGIRYFLDICEDSCAVGGTALFSWSLKGKGFGQIYFYTGEDGKTHCHNECMSNDSIKQILSVLVDTCTMDDK